MKSNLATLCLATLGGVTALLLPATGLAANIGTYGNCTGGSKNTAITAAGHTPVAVATLDAASLAGLGGLIIESCEYSFSSLSTLINPDVKAAVSNGMFLVIDDWGQEPGTSSALPGNPAITWQSVSGSEINLIAGMPYTTGPGGTLTNTSLDGGTYSYHRFTTSPIPAGITRLLTTANPSETVAIAYLYGSGRVVYSAMPLDIYLPGGMFSGNVNAPGVQTYMTNILANNALATPTTCASEGYTGTKLTWCKNICENGLTGATLDIWIHRWINRYRKLPACAAEGGGEEEPPPQGD
jgi:hypothetical protein